MKIDGVRVIANHKDGCTARLFSSQFEPARWRDRAGRMRGRGFAWRVYTCHNVCPAEVWIRADKFEEFAAYLMRQAEER